MRLNRHVSPTGRTLFCTDHPPASTRRAPVDGSGRVRNVRALPLVVAPPIRSTSPNAGATSRVHSSRNLPALTVIGEIAPTAVHTTKTVLTIDTHTGTRTIMQVEVSITPMHHLGPTIGGTTTIIIATEHALPSILSRYSCPGASPTPMSLSSFLGPSMLHLCSSLGGAPLRLCSSLGRTLLRPP